MNADVTLLTGLTDTQELFGELQGKCPVCGEKFHRRDTVVLCRKCKSPHHIDCFEYNQCCSTYGCGCSTASPFAETGLKKLQRLLQQTQRSITPDPPRQSLRLVRNYQVPNEPFFWDEYHYWKYQASLFCQEHVNWDSSACTKAIEIFLVAILLCAPFLLLSVSLDRMMQWAFLTTLVEVWTIARIHSLKSPGTGKVI